MRDYINIVECHNWILIIKLLRIYSNCYLNDLIHDSSVARRGFKWSTSPIEVGILNSKNGKFFELLIKFKNVLQKLPDIPTSM